MALIPVTPTTPGRRHLMLSQEKYRGKPEKRLVIGAARKISGRNSTGRITVRHRGGGEQRQLRLIDWKRDKKDVVGRVSSIEYDPNRSAAIALIVYADGDKRYVLAPEGLAVDQKIQTGEKAPIAPGNALPLVNIPVGTPIHNLEIRPGKGAQMVRSAGQAAYIQAKENHMVDVKLPSGELRRFHEDALATIGQIGNVTHKDETYGKAGRRRHMGWRPEVRGVAMNPRSHPHGGGEGRSGIGMKSPKSPWGKRTLGKKTRHVTYSDKYIIKDRRVK